MHDKETEGMKKSTKLRLLDGAAILFFLWLIGYFNLVSMPVLAATIGCAIGYEILVVGPHVKGRGNG